MLIDAHLVQIWTQPGGAANGAATLLTDASPESPVQSQAMVWASVVVVLAFAVVTVGATTIVVRLYRGDGSNASSR
jgi:hypothetical protein